MVERLKTIRVRDIPAIRELKNQLDIIEYKLEELEALKPRITLIDRIIHWTSGWKTVVGAVVTTGATVKNIVTSPTTIWLVVIGLGVVLLLLGLLHKWAKKSSHGTNGEFWVSDLARLILSILRKSKEGEHNGA